MPKRKNSRRKKGCSAILPKHFWNTGVPGVNTAHNSLPTAHKAAAPHKTTHCLNLNIYLPYTDSSYCLTGSGYKSSNINIK